MKQEREEELHFNNFLMFCHICFVVEEEDFCLVLVNDPGDEGGVQTRKICCSARPEQKSK